MTNTIYRTLKFTMDATVDNHNKFIHVFYQLSEATLQQYVLSEFPQPGDVWKNGRGDERTISRCSSPSDNFVLQSKHSTYKEDGIWYFTNNRTGLDNLFERVLCSPKLSIEHDEYWLDRNKEAHHIIKTPSGILIETNGDKSWTPDGKNIGHGLDDKHDLIQKLVVISDCNNHQAVVTQPLPPVTRSCVISMEATVTNHRLIAKLVDGDLTNVSIIDYALSQLPQPGEIWKNGFGRSFLLGRNYHDTFTLNDWNNNRRTWWANGMFCTDNISDYNLIERVTGVTEISNIIISHGEYWMDRSGNVHLVVQHSGLTDTYANAVSNDQTLLKWTKDGKYITPDSSQYISTDSSLSPHDLMQKMIFVD